MKEKRCAGLTQILDKVEDTKKYNVHIVFDDTKTIEYLDLDNNVVAIEKPHKYVKNKKENSKK